MGFGDMVGKAKDMLGGAGDEQVDQAIDAAAGVAKEHTPDQVDGVVDQAAEAAKDAL